MWVFYAVMRAAIALNQKRLARQQEAQDRLWRVLHPLLGPGAGAAGCVGRCRCCGVSTCCEREHLRDALLCNCGKTPQ